MPRVRKKSIGVFDSGLGGLTILKEIVREMPEYRYIYLGDTARTPYGNRSQAAVLRFSKQAVDFLFKEGCELIVFACNTSSAEALRAIQSSYLHRKYGKNKRVLGVIVPTLEKVASLPSAHRVGIIATEGTVRSETYPREFKKLAPHLKVFQQAAPLLVPLIEAGNRSIHITHLLLKLYLKPLLQKKIDTLVLGCTHYGHLEKEIKKIVGKKVSVISEGPIVARKLKEYLVRHPEIESKLAKKGDVAFYSTDVGASFERLTRLFLGKKITLRRVELE